MPRPNRGIRLARNERGIWEARWTVAGRSRRVSTKTTERSEAERFLFDFDRRRAGAEVQARSWGAVVTRMLSNARTNAQARRREFTLTKDDLLDLLERQRYRCAVSGASLMPTSKGRRRDPWAPSLDRANSSKGYTPDNVRVVCMIVNFACNCWGLAPLLVLSRLLAKDYSPEGAEALRADRAVCPPDNGGGVSSKSAFASAA